MQKGGTDLSKNTPKGGGTWQPKLVDKTVISVSAKESSGIDELSDTIKEMFFDGQVSFNDELLEYISHTPYWIFRI